MSDTAQHCKARVLIKSKFNAHPREKMRQAEMSSFDSFGYASASAREGESRYAIWSKNYVGVCVT